MRKLKKKHKMIIIIAVLLAVLVSASLYTVLIRPSLNEVKTEYEAATVTRGTVRVTVNESGAITYEQSSVKYELDLDVSDDDDDDDDDEEETTKYLVVEEVYRSAGEIVKQGDPLVKFSESSIVSVRKLLASAVADAQVDYNDAKNEYELSCLEAETDYKTTLIEAEYAKKLYGDATSKVSDNISSIKAEISQRESQNASLQTKIDEAAEDYNEAYNTYVEAQALINSADITNATTYLQYQRIYLNAQTAYSNALTALETAEDNLENNKAQITKLKSELSSAQSTREIDSLSAEQQYEENVQSGENAYLVYTAKLESLAEDLEEEKENLEKREQQQKKFEELVGEDGIVYAPRDGLIVEVGVNVNDELTNDRTMVSYVCSDGLTISVDVTEEDIVSLSIGQPVDIVFTAYPDVNYEGKIISIETTATSSSTNTVSYSVVVSLEGDLTKMYGGMTAKVSFEIDKSEDTLFITRKALVESNGSYYVYVKNGIQEYELKKVTIGLKNTSEVEIISGLNEGDTIYIATIGS